MMPITIEFTVKGKSGSIREESVALASAEDLFAFIAPGGDCEKMPSDLDEIQMVFLPPKHPNIGNPLADKRVTLQLGLIMITAPLSTIVQVTQEMIDKMGRGELSEAFLAAAGLRY